jgi:hypothetical protein
VTLKIISPVPESLVNSYLTKLLYKFPILKTS